MVLLFFDFREANGFNRGNFSNSLDHLLAALDKHFVEGIATWRIARFFARSGPRILPLYVLQSRQLFRKVTITGADVSVRSAVEQFVLYTGVHLTEPQQCIILEC
jgi:hypothetical protein